MKLSFCSFACLILLAGALPCSAAMSLLRNGGFERDGGWTIGQYTAVVTDNPHSGRRCLRAEGDRGATAEQTVWAVQPGGVYTASGWIRTQGVAPDGNGFAYLAVYQHDASGRLVDFIDFAKVTGSTSWTEYRHTLHLAQSTEYVIVKAGIFNARGVAWFDDINFVSGETGEPWHEPIGAAAPGGRYRAAILDEPSLPIVGHATPVATFRKALAQEGIPLQSLSASELTAGALSADSFDLLIVPTGATFPVEARRPLLGFLMAGGDLLCTGGYAFDNLVAREGSGWIPYRKQLERSMEAAREVPVPNGGFEDGIQGWIAEAATCVVDDTVAASGVHSGRVHSDAPEAGGRWTRELSVEPGRAYLIGAQAKCSDVHGSHYAFLAVYQYDADGKLLEFTDFAKLTGTQDWQRYETRVVISPSAKRVLFHAGLYLVAGTLWVDDLTCAPVPQEERINAHFGEPMDGLIISPVQLTLFSPDQPLDGVRGVGVWPGWPAIELQGAVRGYDATAQLRQSARWQPLVEARDAEGQVSGAVGSLVTHYSGPFAGSRWALFGVTNRDVFSGTVGSELLRRTVRLMAQHVAARSLTTDYALYKPGESVRIKLALHAPRGDAALDQPLTLTLTLDAPGYASAPLLTVRRQLNAGTPLPTERTFDWKVPQNAPDFVRARAVLQNGPETLDTIETGFCIASPKVIASGTRIRYGDNAYELQPPGKPASRTTLFGTDTYANMFLSPSCSPLTWYRDLTAMRQYGLHMYENLQYPPNGWKYTETEWRRMDALIQLSQRFGLPYMAGLLIGVNVAVDDATLKAQADMCRSFAERYRDVPGLIYYLNGDFRLDMQDLPDIRRMWNDFLRQRYGSEEALRQAWGDEAVQQPLGKIPVGDYASAKPFSERVRDTRLFQTFLVRRWVSALTAAIRTVDKDHPITSEYYQRPYSGIDLRLSINGMDAANFGYFGPPREDIAQLLATIKWNDMRRAGKTINIGEFGVKTHDAWAREHDAFGYHVGRTEEEQRRHLWWVVHAALAYEVTKIQNWCWADDPDSIFPWGVAYNNPLRPKPVLKLWNKLRKVSDAMPQAYEPSGTVFVMPDSWRLGASEPAAWKGIASALESMLATNVRFDVINEDQVRELREGSVRLIVAPFASRMAEAVQAQLVKLAETGATVYVSDPPNAGLLAERVKQATPTTINGWLRAAFGNGMVIASPAAWEAMPDYEVFVRDPEVTADPARNPYLQLVQLAAVEPAVRVEATAGIWRATARRAGGRTLVALFRRDDGRAPVPVTVRVAGSNYALRWKAVGDWPCLAVVDTDGKVLIATANGDIARSGDVRVLRDQPPSRR